ncbi:PadR family transcriptional regulator [Specibacter sp. NPDC078692]|uniref:PadR family transcriptional regulator n=1 Tax=Specibacter sp. NPDC078692 TaxID=3155818 RepID=UPI00342218D4
MSTSLSSSAFWILTTLASGRRHGYEIMLESAKVSDGRVELKATTLYAALERLERDGLVAADGEEIVSGRARRYYRLTDQGATRLDEEARVLQSQARMALKRLSGHSYAFTSPGVTSRVFAQGFAQGFAQ